MTLKPQIVIDEITEYYTKHPSCHNRATHEFGDLTTNKVDKARDFISKAINCRQDESIVFTKNTTESLNLVANSIDFKKGDVVLTTDLEHNSNLLPWQFLKVKKGITFVQIPITPDQEAFDLELFKEILSKGKVKLVSLFHISNITGIELPIKEITELAHANGALVLLDAAQSVPHKRIDVQDLDIDFMAFSFHKAYGPTGMGALYGKASHLEKWIPFLVGGEGIEDTTYETCVLSSSPKKFEVGLQNYAGIIGSGAAFKWLSKIKLDKAHDHVLELNNYISSEVLKLNGVTILGPKEAKLRNGIINFTLNDRNPAEISLMLSKLGKVMTRSGVHCGHSWFHKYELQPSLRVSLSFYNTKEEADKFIEIIKGFNR